MGRYFKTYKEAWEFVHKFATGGYDHNKQAEACEAFRMMNEAAMAMDNTAEKDYRGDKTTRERGLI